MELISIAPPKQSALKCAETDKVKIWTIARVHKYNPQKKKRVGSGYVITATQWKDKPYKITFKRQHYSVINGHAKFETSNTKYCFSLKSGKLNIFAQNGNELIRNVSHKFSFGLIGPKLSKAAVGRIITVLNQFFKSNKFGARISKKEWLDFDKKQQESTAASLIYCGLNDQIRNICYPALKLIGFDHKFILDTSYTSALRRPIGLKKFLKKVIGSAGKKITNNFLALDDINKKIFLKESAILKGFAPIDYINHLLDERLRIQKERKINGLYQTISSWSAIGVKFQHIREFFKLFGAERTLILIKNEDREYDSYISDAIKIWASIRNDVVIPAQIAKEGWEAMHDWLYKESAKLSNKPRPIEYEDNWTVLDNQMVDDYSFILPRSTSDLIEWGQRLNFCIGAKFYQDEAVSKKRLLFALYRDGALAYCGDIGYGAFNQLMGNHNSNPPKELREKVVDVLLKLDILKEKTMPKTNEQLDAARVPVLVQNDIPF